MVDVNNYAAPSTSTSAHGIGGGGHEYDPFEDYSVGSGGQPATDSDGGSDYGEHADHFLKQANTWWKRTTNPDFLMSRASRRDLWAVMLPLPGLLMALEDVPSLTSGSSPILMDIAGSLILLALACFLPRSSILSDAAIATTYVLHVVARDTVALGFLCIIVMSFGGIHASMLAGYVVAAVAGATLFASAGCSMQVIIGGCLVVALAFVCEGRISEHVANGLAHYPSYQAIRQAESRGQTPNSRGVDDAASSSMAGRAAAAQRFSASLSEQPLALPGAAAHEATKAPRNRISFADEDAMKPNFAVDVALKGVKLCGFRQEALNVLFVERPEAHFKLNAHATYWTAAGDYFLCYCEADEEAGQTWGIAKAAHFGLVKARHAHVIACSPENYDILGETVKEGWKEWDWWSRKLVFRPGSGAESRGKRRFI